MLESFVGNVKNVCILFQLSLKCFLFKKKKEKYALNTPFICVTLDWTLVRSFVRAIHTNVRHLKTKLFICIELLLLLCVLEYGKQFYFQIKRTKVWNMLILRLLSKQVFLFIVYVCASACNTQNTQFGILCNSIGRECDERESARKRNIW